MESTSSSSFLFYQRRYFLKPNENKLGIFINNDVYRCVLDVLMNLLCFHVILVVLVLFHKLLRWLSDSHLTFPF
jgi:hypothetical protein